MRLTARRLRLASGVVLLVYITLHLINHALGLWSLDLAGAGLGWSMTLWQSVPGTILLYGSAALHFALALRTVYVRRSWRLPLVEWVRLWAGLSLPLLLIGHAVATRLAVSLYGIEPSYQRIIVNIAEGGAQGWQIALLAPGWLHGCLGLWISLRRWPLMLRLKPLLFAVLVGVPVMSALGFLEMMRRVEAEPHALIAPSAAMLAQRAALQQWSHMITYAYIALVAAAFLAGQVRNRVEMRRA